MNLAERPLRILQIMRAPVGGLFRHVADLTRELAARGHEVGLVVDSQSGDAQTGQKLDDLRPAASLGVHRLPMPRVLGFSDATTLYKIRRLAKSLDISILHGHGAKGGLSARLSALGARDRHALYTPHGGVLHFDPGSFTGRVFLGIERALLGCTDAVIFESEYARKTFANHVGKAPEFDSVIHNGLLESEFTPVAQAPDAADFVYIGELRLLKGIDVLIDAFASLSGRDGRPARLVIAGDGPDRAWLIARIEALGLADRVQFVGVQPARTVFERGGCVIVPSRAESLPYIVLEAAAAGRPLIATRVGGIPEIAGPTAASLIASGSAAALQNAMQQYLDNTDAAKREAEQRMEHVSANFSAMTMVDAIEALYRRVSR